LNNNNSNGMNKNTNQPSFGQKLGLFAQIITTIGDILATVSAGIQIEEGLEQASKDEQENKATEQQLTKMQNQIDSLQREIRLMKKNNLT
jgi:hypothetical protein